MTNGGGSSCNPSSFKVTICPAGTEATGVPDYLSKSDYHNVMAYVGKNLSITCADANCASPQGWSGEVADDGEFVQGAIFPNYYATNPWKIGGGTFKCQDGKWILISAACPYPVTSNYTS